MSKLLQVINIHADKSVYLKFYFLISQLKHVVDTFEHPKHTLKLTCKNKNHKFYAIN